VAYQARCSQEAPKSMALRTAESEASESMKLHSLRSRWMMPLA